MTNQSKTADMSMSVANHIANCVGAAEARFASLHGTHVVWVDVNGRQAAAFGVNAFGKVYNVTVSERV